MINFGDDRNTYRYPRWPIVQNLGHSVSRIFIGIIVALYLPLHPLNLLGVALIIWGYLSWHIG